MNSVVYFPYSMNYSSWNYPLCFVIIEQIQEKRLSEIGTPTFYIMLWVYLTVFGVQIIVLTVNHEVGLCCYET